MIDELMLKQMSNYKKYTDIYLLQQQVWNNICW